MPDSLQPEALQDVVVSQCELFSPFAEDDAKELAMTLLISSTSMKFNFAFSAKVSSSTTENLINYKFNIFKSSFAIANGILCVKLFKM